MLKFSMHSIELEKAYDPKSFEDRIYAVWKESGAFKPCADSSKNHYSVVIPPPNVTGILHMGHALNITLQDIVVRYHRMRGEPTLWVPGCDHAGIATQNVVEKRLRAKGILRHDLGREQFVAETWKVKAEHHEIISRQIAKIGASVDWSRERFTLDSGLSKAVREVFVSLYERGLLYKGRYLVNWCTSCGTALADDEVEHEEMKGLMYHIRYPVAGSTSFVEIATTRPETMLGDTALAVYPDDGRYKDLIGKMVALPLTGREIPVIADTYVDKTFGTGVVKITPAHDPNDWDVGKRHNLPVINILNEDGTLNDEVPAKYRGLKMAEARKIVLADLVEGGFFIKDEEIKHAVGHCYRCHTVIEPFLSEQWFVRMKPLAEKALAAWKGGDLIFYPKKWENTYSHWLNNIRDWCISRQLWWGHRIPAWTCAACGKITVSRTDINTCPDCGGALAQDEDVLDTWFSSWLWPFSTLGWPAEKAESEGGAPPSLQPPAASSAAPPPRGAAPKTPPVSTDGALRGVPAVGGSPQQSAGGGGDFPPHKSSTDLSDLERFYPTTALVTAYDIIFFWVARMIMAGLEFTGRSPFRDIYIHGLVRDKQGRKISKSLGNGIDPLELVAVYGADALKFTLAFLCAQGQDILIDDESFKLGSKFANKVWNASRYILMNLEGCELVENPPLLPVDKWIYARLRRAAKTMSEAFNGYRYNEAALCAYEYFWNDFCDWYVEATKLSTKQTDGLEKNRAVTVLLNVLAESLRLLHPLLPFVTEEIWGKLPFKEGDAGLLITQPYPDDDISQADTKNEAGFVFLQNLVRAIRTLRSEAAVTPDKKLRVTVKVDAACREQISRNKPLVCLLAGLNSLDVAAADSGAVDATAQDANAGAVVLAGSGFEAFVYIAEAVDTAALKTKWAREVEKDKKFITTLQAKLANENFVKNAPPELVEAEKAKLVDALERTGKIETYLKTL
ncbi:hypothetical protein FACS189494_01350 [Spirochaetia bacterium]|nr:hypothetical protein FACS189494_01350 [Spirochaetia bacterium]